MAAGVKTFIQEHQDFIDRPRQAPRNLGVEWSYHGLYTWNLRRRLERQDYLVTEDVLCGIRLVIELSGRQDVITLVRTIQLGEHHAIQLSPAEIEDMRQHDNTIIPIFRPGVDNTIGHWSLAIYQRARSSFLVFDSLHPDDSYRSALREVHDAVVDHQGSAPASIYDVPTTQQVYGWTCGLIVIEYARCFLAIGDRVMGRGEDETLPFEQLDWTQQEPYLSGIHDPDLREVSAISYWIEVISQYLGVPSPSNAAADGQADVAPQRGRLETPADGTADGTVEPADPAVLLFQEWNGAIGCTSQQHEDDHHAQMEKATEERGAPLTCSSLLDVAKRLEGRTPPDGNTNETRLPSVLDPAQDLLRPGPSTSVCRLF